MAPAMAMVMALAVAMKLVMALALSMAKVMALALILAIAMVMALELAADPATTRLLLITWGGAVSDPGLAALAGEHLGRVRDRVEDCVNDSWLHVLVNIPVCTLSSSRSC